MIFKEGKESGVFLIYKEKGELSMRVVEKLKRKFSFIKKVGHCGTLDPIASGLLVCVVNKATKLSDYVMQGRKIYRGVLRLGVSTTTDDLDGEVVKKSEELPSFDKVKKASELFQGEIMQVPPAVSAVKVRGKRAYERVRKGEEVTLKGRRVYLYNFYVKEHTRPDEIFFELTCSKGFYVRALVRDLGEKLGCGAALKDLERVYLEPFSVERAKRVEEVEEQDLIPWQEIFAKTPVIEFPSSVCLRLMRGEQKTLSRSVMLLDSAAGGSKRLLYKCSGCQKVLGLLERGGFIKGGKGVADKEAGVRWQIGANVEECKCQSFGQLRGFI
ncbi:MAG: tRNA pseudouridine(55) synthase TruB [Candidatus Dadabacteria bacterium]|nr:MAG: tRNA pseudouridine(55) synthase TruB [Candidatus Dadabacteria bacterium]